jgi:hypothetical protein
MPCWWAPLPPPSTPPAPAPLTPPPPAPATQESLLNEDIGLRPEASASPSLSGPFPCLAEELEEQAKALEIDW